MIYVYRCGKCRKEFEVKKPISEVHRREYCSCGEEGRRVFTPVDFIWGFGGWTRDKDGLGDNMVLRHKGN